MATTCCASLAPPSSPICSVAAATHPPVKLQGMKRVLAILGASVWIGTAQAQGAPPPPPPASSPSQTTGAPASQPPQRGNIAPILDIRIQDQGISLPKPREDAPPEKPPAK